MTARYVVCPEPYTRQPGRAALFLAGGITGCPDWQSQLAGVPLARLYAVDFLNPRRPAFDVQDTETTKQQIKWEHEHLIAADAILFWFCAETVQPIALFELGRWSGTSKPLFVGCDPRYPRKADVIEQLALSRPDVRVHEDGLAALTWQVEHWLTYRQQTH